MNEYAVNFWKSMELQYGAQIATEVRHRAEAGLKSGQIHELGYWKWAEKVCQGEYERAGRVQDMLLPASEIPSRESVAQMWAKREAEAASADEVLDVVRRARVELKRKAQLAEEERIIREEEYRAAHPPRKHNATNLVPDSSGCDQSGESEVRGRSLAIRV
jgi:hypothetical protein